ncbi:MAG: hypothetical protein IPI00_01935 [Flavobacteriales bacterium]|nr:hypothetical protein [Flavobacteriales bacterium]MBK6946111.1 hypothetical protein [Flavobacteriales bacterium]MBK7238944.1 hypothetical protein [Flavobacteriales bacterium]MBK7296874.1 hypothetical protein [Flavobacteriales bacterium]MBK9536942.1 hypothetical protein [Flavobacteriales bacterium]
MKWLLPISFLTISPCVAQVGIDVPLQFTGPTGQRGIDGIASPTSADQLITVGHAVSGMAHWCIAVLNADTFELSMDPTSGPLASGTMLRFIATQEISGPVFVRINELNPYPLLRGDGIDPVAGQIEAGAICELVLSDGVFTLTAPSRRGCPARTVQLNTQVCVDSTVLNTTLYYEAIDHCASKGGRLCTWQEFFLACTHTDPPLGDVLLNWEWVDDTANHTHTLGQAGGTSCMGQRSVPTLDIVPGATRCCYHIRQ